MNNVAIASACLVSQRLDLCAHALCVDTIAVARYGRYLAAPINPN
jgi:hypothetical protein